ncbi:hypothetical protein NEHOM01_2463, partial [Nematocida homosporus]|uniref:uncharacterized protein n=1 Tax=Nematocida homosporus TaxID=1912981 RepID=UPI002220A7E0
MGAIKRTSKTLIITGIGCILLVSSAWYLLYIMRWRGVKLSSPISMLGFPHESTDNQQGSIEEDGEESSDIVTEDDMRFYYLQGLARPEVASSFLATAKDITIYPGTSIDHAYIKDTFIPNMVHKPYKGYNDTKSLYIYSIFIWLTENGKEGPEPHLIFPPGESYDILWLRLINDFSCQYAWLCHCLSIPK